MTSKNFWYITTSLSAITKSVKMDILNQIFGKH